MSALAARPARIGFDLDGTLLHTVGHVYEDPVALAEATSPIARACQLAHNAANHGHAVAYFTGRAEHVRSVTWQQIVRWLPSGPLHMSQKWDGYDAMARTKAAALRLWGADLYVGDHEADANAAAMAGIPFLHADHWHAGKLPLHLQHVLTPPRRLAAAQVFTPLAKPEVA